MKEVGQLFSLFVLTFSNIGWPREIDHTEPADVQKYLKKMYRETNLGFAQATKEMCLGATKSIL